MAPEFLVFRAALTCFHYVFITLFSSLVGVRLCGAAGTQPSICHECERVHNRARGARQVRMLPWSPCLPPTSFLHMIRIVNEPSGVFPRVVCLVCHSLCFSEASMGLVVDGLRSGSVVAQLRSLGDGGKAHQGASSRVAAGETPTASQVLHSRCRTCQTASTALHITASARRYEAQQQRRAAVRAIGVGRGTFHSLLRDRTDEVVRHGHLLQPELGAARQHREAAARGLHLPRVAVG